MQHLNWIHITILGFSLDFCITKGLSALAMKFTIEITLSNFSNPDSFKTINDYNLQYSKKELKVKFSFIVDYIFSLVRQRDLALR